MADVRELVSRFAGQCQVAADSYKRRDADRTNLAFERAGQYAQAIRRAAPNTPLAQTMTDVLDVLMLDESDRVTVQALNVAARKAWAQLKRS